MAYHCRLNRKRSTSRHERRSKVFDRVESKFDYGVLWGALGAAKGNVEELSEEPKRMGYDREIVHQRTPKWTKKTASQRRQMKGLRSLF